MMPTRIVYLLIGCVIGFVIGYLVRMVREINDKVEEVDRHILQEEAPPKQSRGRRSFMACFSYNNIMMICVLAIVVWSAFASQSASNKVKDQQQRQTRATACTQQYLAVTISALNARTSNNSSQNNANVALQNAQLTFLKVFFINPPAPDTEKIRALQTYVDALNRFVSVTSATNKKVDANPYPTTTDFAKCLDK